MKTCLLRFVLLIFLGIGPSLAHAYQVTIDFEGPFDGAKTYCEKGFCFSSLSYGFFRRQAETNLNPNYATAPAPISGTFYGQCGVSGSTTVMSNVYGQPFTLLGVDLAEYSEGHPGTPTEIVIQGFHSDNTVALQTFTIDGITDGFGPIQDFQRLHFDPAFTNVTRVEIQAAFSVDNLVIEINTPNQPPQVSLEQPVNGSRFVLGQTISFLARATDPDGELLSVNFYDTYNGITNWLGRVQGGGFALPINNLELGDHLIRALATDDQQNTKYSSPVSIAVIAEIGTTTLDLYSSEYNSEYGASKTIALAQTFIPKVSGLLDHVNLVVGPAGDGSSSPLTVSILDANSQSPGTNVLGEAIVPAVAIAIGGGEVYFTNSPYLLEGVCYAIKLSSPSILPLGVRTDMYDHYLEGRLWQQELGQANAPWQLVTGPSEWPGKMDLIFATFMTPKAPPVRVTKPAQHSRVQQNMPLIIEAVVSPEIANIQYVEFFSDEFCIGTNTNTRGIYSLVYTNKAEGLHRLQVKAHALDNLIVSSSIVTFQTVSPNQAPSFTKGPDLTLFAYAGRQPGIHIISNWCSIINPGKDTETNQTSIFVLDNDNPQLFTAQPAINAYGTLAFALATNAFGTAQVSILLKDNGGTEFGGTDTSAVQTFSITVLPVNNAPSFTPGEDITVSEDCGTQSFTNWATGIIAGAESEKSQRLTVLITNDNNGLFAIVPMLELDGTLTFTPGPDMYGDVTVKIVLKDNGGTENGGIDESEEKSFSIFILPVDDPPSFTSGPDIQVLEDVGLQVFTHWASNMCVGPLNESEQHGFFFTDTDRPELFSQLPMITPEGALSFKFKANSNGVAHVSVQLGDDGNFYWPPGEHLSPIHDLIITAVSVYDPPLIGFKTPTNGMVFNEGTKISLSVTNLYTESILKKVEFYAETNKVGEDDSSPYGVSWSGAQPGTYKIVARGIDDRGETNNTELITIRVNARPSIVLESPTNNAIVLSSQLTSIEASAHDTDGTVQQIDFYDVVKYGSSITTTRLGTVTNAPYTLCCKRLAVGTHAITAQVEDNNGLWNTSLVATVLVTRPPILTETNAVTLIADSSVWRYWQTGNPPSNGWKELAFDDSNWTIGVAEFGFGDGDEVTRVEKFGLPTYYFRQPFIITNLHQYKSLALSLLRDDGGVVYLNGKEVFRSNMPGGPITYFTPAVAPASGDDGKIFYNTNISASLLVEGFNVVAVEIHQLITDRTNFSFDLRLCASAKESSIESITRFSDGWIRLEILTEQNKIYSVEYSTNLVDWLQAETNMLGDGTKVQWNDNSNQSPCRFYRLHIQ